MPNKKKHGNSHKPYGWLRKHGWCVSCKKNRAVIDRGHVMALCESCREVDRQSRLTNRWARCPDYQI